MIFVTLGTQDKEFPRLLKQMEKEIKNGNIKEEVIVQRGYTKYSSKYMKMLDLVSTEEFKKLVKDCDLLITHGGVGSILEGIKQNKKIIAVPRKKEYKEHTNDHQIQILKEFASLSYIIAIDDVKDLSKALEQSKTFKPKTFKSNTKHFIDSLENYIEETNHTSYLNKYINKIEKGQIGILETMINVFLFCAFYHNQNLFLSVFLAYLCTFIIEKILHFLANIKPQKKYYFLKGFYLLLDFLFTYVLITFLPLSNILSKILCNILLLFLSIFISKK